MFVRQRDRQRRLTSYLLVWYSNCTTRNMAVYYQVLCTLILSHCVIISTVSDM